MLRKWLDRLHAAHRSGSHDWDMSFERLKNNEVGDAVMEVDWSDPDVIGRERERMADVFVNVLGESFIRLSDRYADIPLQGRLAVIGALLDATDAFATFNTLVLLNHADISVGQGLAALNTDEEDWEDWLEDAARLRAAERDMRSCDCGNWHPFELPDGSTCLLRRSGDSVESVLVPVWHGCEGDA